MKRYSSASRIISTCNEVEDLSLLAASNSELLLNDDKRIVGARWFTELPSVSELACLKALPFLREICLENGFSAERSSIESNSIEEISSNSNLGCLLIRGWELAEGALASLPELQKLEVLRLRNCGLNDKHMQSLSRVKHLRHLTLAANPRISIQKLQALVSAFKLETLALTREMLGGLDVEEFSKGIEPCELIVAK